MSQVDAKLLADEDNSDIAGFEPKKYMSEVSKKRQHWFDILNAETNSVRADFRDTHTVERFKRFV